MSAIDSTERAFIGALLLRPNEADAIIGLVGEDDFEGVAHRTMYVAMARLFDRGDSTGNLAAIERQLVAMEALGLVGGVAGVGRYADVPGSGWNYETNARAIREAAAARRLRDACAQVVESHVDATEDPQSWVDANAAFLGPYLDGIGRPVRLIGEGSSERLQRILDHGALPSVPTGFPSLDALIKGVHGLTILAARPSMGKSALALRIARRCAEPVIFFSLEMEEDEQYVRLLSDEADVLASKIEFQLVNPAERDALERARQRLDAVPLAIVTRPSMTITDIRSQARTFLRQHARGRRALVVVDYLQLVRGAQRHSIREQEVSEISRGLKALATETKCPVLALSQLNRELEKRDDKRPRKSDLRESGSIEQDANCILMLWRPEAYSIPSIKRGDVTYPSEGLAEVVIEKQRNGPTSYVLLRFDGRHTRFTEMQQPARQQEMPT